MATVELIHNKTMQQMGEPVPFKAHRNFYVAIAQCEAYANHPVTYINPYIGVIPVDKNRRLVVTA
ncbi:hypothetical protein F0249_19195 [Vibrio sp. 03-59-1]|uniref:hypothetical protein n=1 Tax=Vibrio sp. 03-59-1 TaxID=2607607 RepID=UPI0014933E30|nr:hypothetical protein [Vibrio sp. 03-59-1]NOH85916.1 hypothetical protein [Vibrio sp. 03-59-1]